MLTNTKIILKKAQANHYAIGHFNINNLELVQGIVQAANNLNSPIILATSEGAVKYAGINFLYQLAATASELSKVPIALHLDHGKDLNVIKQAIQLGYSSVMIDASHETIEKNIQLTKKVVRLAHQKGISVEAELGTIGGVEDSIKSKNILYTDPQKAQEFVQKTGCDFLAIAIGTSHGAYKFPGKAKLHQQLLQEIKQKVTIPLVLHGASTVPLSLVNQANHYGAKLTHFHGVPESEIKQAIRNGICKINTDTDLRIAFTTAIRQSLTNNPQEFDPRSYLAEARNSIQHIVEQKIKLFGSVNKK
ncbi:class II fructose-1,6-bisphosphate aldolase [Candidatus Woesearchaeota archaeon]|nr:class II fructose-1,6-bisphosphate aldolase [Candidatus Woesearchaeota archaeon]